MRSHWNIMPVMLALLGACSGDESIDPTDSLGSDSADTAWTGTQVPVTVSEGGVVTCANPSLREETRFDRRVSDSPPNSDLWIWSGGELAGDFDRDGWMDAMTPNEFGVELYRGSPTGFTPMGRQVLGHLDLSFGTGGSVVDFDGDGDLDVYITRFAGEPGPDRPGMGENRLLANNGDGTFEDVTVLAGVDGCGLNPNTGSTGCYRTMTSSWADMDGDSDLDLFVGNYGWVDESGAPQDTFPPAEPSFLYRNNGDGTFTDVSERLPQAFRDGYTYAGGFIDLDDDGDSDLYIVNDFGNQWPNHVLLNNGDGTFFDDALANATGLNLQTTGMGMAAGDFNSDGLVDIGIPKWNGNHLMLSSKFGWIDFADSTGFVLRGSQKVGWGAEAADMDNDGLLEIVQQYGHLDSPNPNWGNKEMQPDAVYHNVGTATQPLFVDVGEEWGVGDPGPSRGAVVVDFNGDGWLDIGKRNLSGPNVAYLSRCGTASWLKVLLQEPGSKNLNGIGAKIIVEAGDKVLTRWVLAGGTGYGAGLPPEQHFGLGDASNVDRITVRWADGGISEVTDVAAFQAVTLTR